MNISEIKYQCEIEGNGQKTSTFKIGVMDKIGNIACWTLQEDILSFASETDGPKKLKAFTLLPPAGEEKARLYGKNLLFCWFQATHFYYI